MTPALSAWTLDDLESLVRATVDVQLCQVEGFVSGDWYSVTIRRAGGSEVTDRGVAALTSYGGEPTFLDLDGWYSLVDYPATAVEWRECVAEMCEIAEQYVLGRGTVTLDRGLLGRPRAAFAPEAGSPILSRRRRRRWHAVAAAQNR